MEHSMHKPSPPQMPPSAFSLYKKEVFESVKEQNPGKKGPELRLLTIKKWNNLPKEDQKKYRDAAATLNKTYLEEKAAYEKQYGPIEKDPFEDFSIGVNPFVGFGPIGLPSLMLALLTGKPIPVEPDKSAPAVPAAVLPPK